MDIPQEESLPPVPFTAPQPSEDTQEEVISEKEKHDAAAPHPPTKQPQEHQRNTTLIQPEQESEQDLESESAIGPNLEKHKGSKPSSDLLEPAQSSKVAEAVEQTTEDTLSQPIALRKGKRSRQITFRY